MRRAVFCVMGIDATAADAVGSSSEFSRRLWSEPMTVLNIPDPAAAEGASTSSSVREGWLEVPGSVALHHGGALEAVKIGWRLVGPATAPIIVALGGISAHRRVVSASASEPGWWDEVVGPGLALPTEAVRILSFDYLGGSGETTATPVGAARFPSVSSFDQAEILLRLLNHLGIRALHGIVGASYGGMVALAFAERYPDRVSRIVVISAADRAHPMATAWRSVQRRMVRFGLEVEKPERGLELARALAMSTYRSPEEFAARFSGSPKIVDGEFVFPVEEYLLARGRDYSRRYNAEAFLRLSESIDLHRIAADRVFVPVTAIAVREDQLVPVADMRAMCARLTHARLHEISSVFGHDAFLKETMQLKPLLAAALEISQ